MIIQKLARLHQEERGAISLISVFTMLFFSFLLLLIVNIGKHIDDKVRMQNAVDAASYSSGVVLARGMNGIAYTNHLLCDVFAMTAYLREGRDRMAEQVVPMAIAAWKEHAKKYPQTQFPRFNELAPLISPKADEEQKAVTAFGDMMAAASEEVLPVFEMILDEELIPEFQRDLLQNAPDLAQQVMQEISMRHGIKDQQLANLSGNIRDGTGGQTTRGNLSGVLWRTDVNAVSATSETDPNQRTLPIVDVNPNQNDFGQVSNASELLEKAFAKRHQLADLNREMWVYDQMKLFRKEAKFSGFADLWNITTCGQLVALEQEYPDSNIPMMLREETGNDESDDYLFVGVTYRKHLVESGPKMFTNQLDKTSDAQAYAQLELYLPRARFTCCPWASPRYDINNNQAGWNIHYDKSPGDWSSFNQNWNIRLVPATDPHLQQIISSTESTGTLGLRVNRVDNLSPQDFETLNTH